MFQNNLLAGVSGNQGFYPYQIEQSLRFNDDDSAYLNRTPASAGNLRTWTLSLWIKRCLLGSRQPILESYSGGNDFTALAFDPNDKIEFYTIRSNVDYAYYSNDVFRDTSAWYHFVFVFDSTDATSTNRWKVYVNGTPVSINITDGPMPQNTDSYVNSTNQHRLFSRQYFSTLYNDAYAAEINLIDGTALDPTSFGETKSGIWVPKAYSGSYGTNGFYLSFADSAAIGDDLSGNGNDWTANNLVSTDVLLDSPTNNYAVFNPILSTAQTFAEGNLKTTTADGESNGSSSIGMRSGKWYAEFVMTDNVTTGSAVGIQNADYYSPVHNMYEGTNRGVGYYSGGDYLADKSDGSANINSYGASWTTGDVMGVAYDADNSQITFYKNNVSQGTHTLDAVIDTALFAVGEGEAGNTATFYANFGQDSSFAGNKTAQGNTDANGVGDFYYAPPSGYLALNTANLPDPAIDPAQDDVPADYFNTVLYTGTGATQSITGVGFQPDWTWIKTRSNTASHSIFDAVRGANNWLASDSTDAATSAQTDLLTSFDADGFSLGANTGSKNTNKSGQTYVGWNWLAGNGTSSNTDGTITSTVSVNQKAGFSVVSYTGNAVDGATVGHGIGAAPSMVIVKARSAAESWRVFHEGLTSGNNIYLNATNAQDIVTGTAGGGIGSTPSSTTFTLVTGAGGNANNINASAVTYIAYCFAEVEGYSKFGSYTGNGSTDGPFVYCGFRPAWIMFKRTNSTGNWIIFDAELGIYNLNDNYLYANSSDAEGTSATKGVDFLSNGFKHRNDYNDANLSGSTYIFMAFAEQPFKYSNAR